MDSKTPYETFMNELWNSSDPTKNRFVMKGRFTGTELDNFYDRTDYKTYTIVYDREKDKTLIEVS